MLDVSLLFVVLYVIGGPEQAVFMGQHMYALFPLKNAKICLKIAIFALGNFGNW